MGTLYTTNIHHAMGLFHGRHGCANVRHSPSHPADGGILAVSDTNVFVAALGWRGASLRMLEQEDR
jgi:hypothetical protein